MTAAPVEPAADGSPKPNAPRRRRKQARPGEIVDAALSLFVERGFAATRLDDVAERAGVSKGTVYLYFDSKEALLAEAVRRDVGPLLGEFAQRIDDASLSASALIELFMRRWWSVLSASKLQGVPKLMVSESGNFPALAGQFVTGFVARMQDELLAAVLRKGVACGEFAPVDVPYAVRVLIHGLVFMPVWMHSLGKVDPRELDPQRYLDCWLDLTLRGLRAPGATP
ncbi:MAG: TetR/AcrR family transcriptional regulator [Rhodanobacteraceae bacterium]|nr:TetR/AcrR family transcriptional regulator [Rhodanobacteraceae bacterium]